MTLMINELRQLKVAIRAVCILTLSCIAVPALAQDDDLFGAGEEAGVAEEADTEPVAIQQIPGEPAATVIEPMPASVIATKKRVPLVDCDIPGLKKVVNVSTPGGMPVDEFIDWLARRENGDFNVAMSAMVKGVVNLSAKDITVADALEIAFAANSLAYEIKGVGPRSIINVMAEAEYRKRYGVGFDEQRQMKIIRLKHAKPSHVHEMLRAKDVKSDIGAIVYDDLTQTLVLIDTPAKIKEMEAIIKRTELPIISEVFKLQYAEPSELLKRITSEISKAGKVTADDRTMRLVVADHAQVIQRVREVVEALDIRQKEVSLEAKIVEVEFSDEESVGINWKHVLQNMDPRFNVQSSVPLSAGSGANLTFKTIAAGGDLTAVLDALKTVGNTKVISNPRIAVLDGPEAMIKVVRDQPYRELKYESGSTNVIAVVYKHVEIGTTLSVACKINDSGFVNVNVKAVISDLVDWYDAPEGSGGLVGVPVVKKAEATTAVSVKDGVTIIIGGMIKTEKRKTMVGIPVLRSIPIVGALFRSTVERTRRAEIVVFLTPKIITGEEPFLEMSSDNMKKLKLRDMHHETEAEKEQGLGGVGVPTRMLKERSLGVN